jgi:hypothetical protein
MFDELHDPDPPAPGMHEFAVVAERAREIRQRRVAWVSRATSLVIVAGAALAMFQVSGNDGPTSGPPATSAVPAAITTLDPSGAGATPSTVSLGAAQSASALPPIVLGPGRLTISDDPLVEIFEATDGSTCADAAVALSSPTCAPAGAGFVVFEYGEGEAARLAIIVDPTVAVGFDAPEATCTQTFPDFAVVQVSVCAGLDADTATVEVQAADRILVRP